MARTKIHPAEGCTPDTPHPDSMGQWGYECRWVTPVECGACGIILHPIRRRYYGPNYCGPTCRQRAKRQRDRQETRS